ncbi:S8 family serine peptidase [Kineococcus rubinsiae]|uniref:S8 family serine peptidase n=1 Tax=Kineococcus rubinsiae TaxID=2609562 RepID=UPI00142F4C4E|nr:S8 family serine peptidase [Kineococcus rubinsiae]NIZ90502.1 S8 family serine peptidase [Kineococcus rubinsiae]
MTTPHRTAGRLLALAGAAPLVALLAGPAAAVAPQPLPLAAPQSSAPRSSTPQPADDGVVVDVLRYDHGRPHVRSVTVADDASAQRLVDRLGDDPSVAVAAVETTYHLSAVARPAAADPLLGRATHLAAIRASAAWPTTTGVGTVVAVLDSGVDPDQPDLVGRVTVGRNFADGTDIGEHGTMVSTVVAGARDNGVGAAGVAPGTSVLAVRVCAPAGCTSSSIANGITYAADRGAAVINLSLGGPDASLVVQRAVDYAIGKGSVVVASAGNYGAPCAPGQSDECGNPLEYPAAYPGVVAVSSGDAGGAQSWAEHGDHVDLSAPGSAVVVGLPASQGHQYALAAGTSFSAPMVSAAAALVRSVAPATSVAAVEQVLRGTAQPQRGWPAGYGTGLLDVGAAVSAVAHPDPVAAPLSTLYSSLGGASSWLGTPLSPALPIRDGGVVQRFTGGLAYSSPATGAAAVRGAIADRYGRAGWENGFLGYPTTSDTALQGGSVTHFQGGSIYFSPATGAQVVTGADRDTWASMGWERGWLGYPSSEEIGLRGGGTVQRFTGGLIYRTPVTGARALRGAILDRYSRTGWENGYLGYPTTSETPIQGGAFTAFQGGSVYWSPATGPQVVRGALRDTWGSLGWERGRLGYPRGEEQPVRGGLRQEFTGGALTFSWATGRTTVTYR